MLVAENTTLSIDRILSDQGIHLLTDEEYREYIRLKNNEEYLNKLDQSIAQLRAGLGQEHELIEVDDDE